MENNIHWIPFNYHKRFSVLATLYDLIIGFCFLLFFIPKNKIKIIHCRSYIASVLGLRFKKIYGTKFIFDMRGFWADERVEGGLIKKGGLYNRLKKLEKKFMLNSDATISLTQTAIKEMNGWPYMKEQHKKTIHHITTCCNIKAFENSYVQRSRNEFSNDQITFLYIGSIGPWHSYKEITNFVDAAYHHLPNSKFKMIINWGIELFEDFIVEKNYDANRFDIGSVPHKEIPKATMDADIGFFFVPPVYAKIASSPTKMGEMLSAGITIITGHSIGDVDYLIEENNIGAIIRKFNNDEFIEKIDYTINLIKNNKEVLSKRCLNVAHDYFSLEKGIEKYNEIYNTLLNE